ncbi:branched-chain amino acid ABC transporter substrate-binding protein [Gordonia sp. X0973]|uniref:branched-chain amino acid ABC transporter substrate-binding protein n=1 Tax=Gordonia sp. X0973 TaxID=2742602 RepID=UPI000F51E425|nr:branched-chain amino acid ABC transporter substrate-binding protein [Gordonia sp. X0973]QKT07116.1 branched-chain amino acid ABC transporter substrate-binding protein [Gordonia sp. X0973]
MGIRRVSAAIGATIVSAGLVAGCASSEEPATPSAYQSGAPSPGALAAPVTSAEKTLDLTITARGQINLEGHRFDAPAPTDPANPAGAGNAKCRRLTIAVTGDLSSNDGVAGAAIANGAQLAVDQHNAANRDCPLVLARVDSKGNTVTAAAQARKLVADKDVIGVVGPLTSADALAAVPILNEAGIPVLSPSATAPTLTDRHWKSFFRGVNNDDVQGEAIAGYLTGTAGWKKACVIADETDGGAGLARAVTQGLGPVADASCSSSLRRGATDFGPKLDSITKAGADGVFFAGSAADAGPFAAALRRAAPAVRIAAGSEANNARFVDLAGDAASGANLSCSCAPDADPFTAAYTAKFGAPPARYSLEAYDLATILIRGIAAKKQNREQLRGYVATYSGNGLSRRYQWAPTGDLIGNSVWLYRVVEKH